MQSFDDFVSLRQRHPTNVLEKITGIQTYQEQTGECKGFQLVYADETTNDYIYVDEYQNIAKTEQLTVPQGEYIKDVQLSIDSLSKKAKLRVNVSDEIQIDILAF